jgi:hypothetical protein
MAGDVVDVVNDGWCGKIGQGNNRETTSPHSMLV